MNDNLRCLTQCCRELGFKVRLYHHSKNMIEVVFGGSSAVFVNWTTPLNPHALARACADKEYAYHYFGRFAAMPRTFGYLDPAVDSEYWGYLRHGSIDAIVEAIDSDFSYPVIVKRNTGSRGVRVYRCESRGDIQPALEQIFRQGRKGYDYVAVAQDYLEIACEYRVVSYRGGVAFAYDKVPGNDKPGDNLSPLHTTGGEALLVKEPDTIRSITSFLAPFHRDSGLAFGGLDLVLDREGIRWLLEVNSAPSFTYFIRDNGEEEVLALYRRILGDLERGSNLDY